MTDVILTDVQNFAAEAHKGQRRKYAKEDYIYHPIRVSSICRSVNETTPVLAAALLHDVLEDTDVTKERMQVFLENLMNPAEAKQTLQLVIDLTDVYTYKDYPTLKRRQRKEKEHERLAAVQPDAQTIKYADVIDNCIDIADSGDDFAPKFLQECRSLLKKMTKGNQQLYAEAKQVVETGLQKVGISQAL